MKIVLNFLCWIIAICLTVIAGVTILSAFNTPIGVKLYTVQSGSMAPTIPTGSVIITKKVGNYVKGDIVTFISEKDRQVKDPKLTTTHRIVKVKQTKKGNEYFTKGDFNPTPDLKSITKNLIIGKVVFTIPYLGFPVSFAKTQTGFIILVVVPATLLIYSELNNIKNELVKLFAKKNENKDS